MLYNFGIEGESYNMVDGKPVFTDLITKNPDGLTFAQAVVKYARSAYSGIFEHNPEYVKQSLTYPEHQQKAYDLWSNTNMVNHLMPPVTLLPEEQSESADIMNNISTYVAEKYVAFITGAESIDNFDEMVAQVNEYGLDRVIELRQAAYDRYMSR